MILRRRMVLGAAKSVAHVAHRHRRRDICDFETSSGASSSQGVVIVEMKPLALCTRPTHTSCTRHSQRTNAVWNILQIELHRLEKL
eukprot:6210562-Pleurochrysis_carterae.AAC.3